MAASGRRQIGVDIEFDANTGGVDQAATAARALDRELEQLERTERRQEQAAQRAERAAEQLAAAQHEAAEAAQKLARGEITAAEAAEKAENALKLEERQARAVAAANLAAARAVDEHADQQRQLARDAELSAAAQRLGSLRASGSVREHDNLIGSLERRFGSLASEGAGAFTRIGESAAESGSKMAASGGPYTMAIAIGAAIGALPAIGAIAGLALSTAVGGALIGIGLKASMSSKTAQDALTRLKEQGTKTAAAIGKPWEQVWKTIGDTGVSELEDLEKPLERLGTELAPSVSKFIQNLAGSLHELGPTVNTASTGFRKFLDGLGSRMPEITSSLNASLNQLATSFSENSDEVARLVTGLIKTIGYLARFLALCTDAFGVLARAGLATKEFVKNLDQLDDKAKDLASGGLLKVAEKLGLVDKGSSGAAKQMGSLDAQGRAVGGTLGALAGTLDATKTSTTSAGTQTDALKTAMMLASQSADQLKSSLDALTGKNIAQRQAMINYQSAVDAMNKSLKENGAAHGFATEKGRANEQALLQLATTGQAATDALKRNKASASDVAAQMQATREQVYQAALKMGYNKTKADSMATALTGVTRAAKNIPTNRTITVKANTAAANAALMYTKNLAGQVGAALGSAAFYGASVLKKKDGGLIGYASGGQVGVQRFPGGGQVRGPGGPREDRVPILASAGEFVINAAATARNLPLLQAINSGRTSTVSSAGGGSSGPLGGGKTVIEIRSGGTRFDDALVEVLRNAIQGRTGGNVQLALGR